MGAFDSLTRTTKSFPVEPNRVPARLIAETNLPAFSAFGGIERENGASSAMEKGSWEFPIFEKFGDLVESKALADTPKVDTGSG